MNTQEDGVQRFGTERCLCLRIVLCNIYSSTAKLHSDAHVSTVECLSVALPMGFLIHLRSLNKASG